MEGPLAMAISKVWIEEGCICCGCSSEDCPEVFKLDNEIDTAIVLKNVDYSKYEEQIKDAADNCPVDVIKYE